jgi:hypothetical protein
MVLNKYRVNIQIILLLLQIGTIIGCYYGKWQWLVIGIFVAILLFWNSFYLPIIHTNEEGE